MIISVVDISCALKRKGVHWLVQGTTLPRVHAAGDKKKVPVHLVNVDVSLLIFLGTYGNLSGKFIGTRSTAFTGRHTSLGNRRVEGQPRKNMGNSNHRLLALLLIVLAMTVVFFALLERQK